MRTEKEIKEELQEWKELNCHSEHCDAVIKTLEWVLEYKNASVA